MQAQVIMIASGKGGTGKSTVSVLLGAQLAARGNRVLLVELDSGLRSVDYISGVYGKTVYDIEDVLAARCPAEKAVVESPLYPNLHIISAPYSGGHISAGALNAFVHAVRPMFHFVILDTAAGMGEPFKAAACVCEMALLVITPDLVTVRDGRIVADTLLDENRIQVRLLLNKVPKTLAGTGMADLDECIDTVGVRLLGAVPLSADIQKAATGTKLPHGKSREVFSAIAARVCGQDIPLIIY